jgi:hypothetical protein
MMTYLYDQYLLDKLVKKDPEQIRDLQRDFADWMDSPDAASARPQGSDQ